MTKKIDCIEFEKEQTIDKLYFDINRWFERVKCRKYEPFGIFDD